MKERWEKIGGYIGYDVSNLGRVRSYWFNRYLKEIPQKFLNPTLTNTGYLAVNIRRGNLRHIHRLVLEAFVGPSLPGMHGCHCDGDKTNNHLLNLRWDTPIGNFSDRDAHGTRWIGDRMPHAKLTHELVREMRFEEGTMSKRALARKYGISLDTCRKALSGETWGGSY